MRRDQLAADGALLFVTAIWGATFVMVQEAVSAFPVFAFLALRFALATATLWPFHLRADRPARQEPATRHSWPGIAVGVALFAGYALQTFGLRYTTPAKAGFITGLSVVLVPLGQAVFLRRLPDLGAVAGVALAAAGLGLLSLGPDLSIGFGDLLALGCAASFAAHILLVGRFAPTWPPIQLAFTQIATVAVLSSALALALERPLSWPPSNVWFAAAFTGLLATSLAFFLQSRAQQATSPTHTALIFAAEPVFAGLFSFLLVGEVLGPRQLLGCSFIVAGMLAAELIKGKRKSQERRG